MKATRRFSMLGAVLLAAAAPVFAQTELRPEYQPVVPGLDYAHVAMKNWDSGEPWSIHIARLDRSRKDLRVASMLSQNEIFGIAPISAQASSVPNATGIPLVAINTDFCIIKRDPYQGAPRGLQIMEGEFVSPPFKYSFWVDEHGTMVFGEVESKCRATLPGGQPFVRLRGQWDRAVEVRFCAVKSRAVSNRNCLAAMRGGEQRNENDQSVTQVVPEDGRRELDSVGVDGRVFERKTKPAKRAIGDEPNRRATGWSPVVAPMVGDRMVGSPRAEIRETRRGQAAFMAQCPKNRPAGVRASVVAKKRVTTVEPRDAGKWKCEGQKDGKANQRECPRGLAGGGISRVQLAWVIPNV